MRQIEVTANAQSLLIYVGKVDAPGKYKLLELTHAEAAVLMMLLKQKIR